MIAILALAAFAKDGIEVIGEVRAIGSLPPEVTVDADGTGSGASPQLDGRLRAGLHGTWGKVVADLEGDAFDGGWAGEPWALGSIDERRRDVGLTWQDSYRLRKAWVAGRTSAGELGVGLTTSEWGLGMVANDGDGDPLFGRSDFGDRVIRGRIASAPFRQGGKPVPVFVIAALDAVVRDDNARISDGQLASQAVLAVLRSTPDGTKAGAYTVLRTQREADPDRSTQAAVVDLYADVPKELCNLTVRAAAEVAGVLGKTDRVLSYAGRDGIGIASMGALVSLSGTYTPKHLGGMLRLAYASGDGNPDDGATHDFSFDRDADVGMVLFDEVAGAIEARTHALLSDPTRAGQPPDGVEVLVTEGAFRRAFAIQPVLTWTPKPWLDTAFGLVRAWSTAPVAHPFYSYRAGGVPHDVLDRPSEGRALGTELDVSVTVGKVQAGRWPTPSLRVQVGHAWLAEGLGGPGTADLAMAEGRVRF